MLQKTFNFRFIEKNFGNLGRRLANQEFRLRGTPCLFTYNSTSLSEVDVSVIWKTCTNNDSGKSLPGLVTV